MSTRPLSYEPFFGLRQKPFSLAPDPEFLYESPTHATALNRLLSGIRRREGLLALTGDVGTGKTTICRALLRSLDQTTFSAFIPDPFASREDLLKMLLIDFGVAKIQDFTTGPLAQAGRTELSYLLSSFLDSLAPLDAFVVVFIDEAQKMSPSLIEEVRILSDNFCRHGQLQIVFVGQLELMETLKSPNLRHVDQRVCVYCRLEPLSLADVAGYVHHRLQVAGGTPGQLMFAPGALALIHEAAGGVPRLLNRYCDRALQEAFRQRLPIVDREVIASVLEDTPSRTAIATSLPALPATGAGSVAQVNTLRGTPTTEPARVATFSPREEPTWPEETPTWPRTPAPAVPDEPPVARRPFGIIERVGRHWARVAAVVAAALVGLTVLSATYMPAPFADPADPLDPAVLPSTPLPDARPVRLSTAVTPQRPDADVSGESVIAVAVFDTVERAERLREALELQGFAGLTRVLVREGRVLYRVLVGPFYSPQAAATDLQRLQEHGEFADARIMTQ
jgi:type II secretory pathway predicted ATPase ExeA/cell division septation protein DedD